MLKCIFVTFLMASFFVSSLASNSTDQNVKCFQSQPVMSVGEILLNSFKSAINKVLETNSTVHLDSVLIPSYVFLNTINETCKKVNMPSNASHTDFIKLMEFSLRDGKFKNFTETGGKLCINAAWSDINKCINQTAGHRNSSGPGAQYIKLAREANLSYTPYTCKQTKLLGNCTKEALKNNTQCKENHVEYVGSLFNFTLTTSPCANITSEFQYRKKNSASSVIFNSVILLLTSIVTMF